MNYPLHAFNKRNKAILTPSESYYTEEYCQAMCDLYLTDEFHRTDSGNVKKFYRLHAKHPHSQEQAFLYDIKCPKCGAELKQIGRQNSYNELGLYTCKHCNNY